MCRDVKPELTKAKDKSKQRKELERKTDKNRLKAPIYLSDLRTNEGFEVLPKLPLFTHKH